MQEQRAGQDLREKFFVLRLIPPRPTFVQDMTDDERRTMQAHQAYWSGLAARGVAILYGPVFDPNGVYGLGVLRVADEAELQAISAEDPVVKGGLHRLEVSPMLAVLGR